MRAFSILGEEKTFATCASPQYDGPNMKTATPGPKSLALLKELNEVQVSKNYMIVCYCALIRKSGYLHITAVGVFNLNLRL